MKPNTKIIILVSLLAIFICLAVLSVSAISSHKPNNEGLSSTSEYYILKDNNGKLAIFKGEDDTPLKQLDVYTELLPERDRTALKSGIRTDTLKQAMQKAEDYE